MDNLITEDEIKQLKTNPRLLSWEDAVPGWGIIPPVVPVNLKSGYLVFYTIDLIFGNSNIKLEHVMVGASGFQPDPVDTDLIAHAILGECVRTPLEWGYSTHYLKIMGLDTTETRRFYEDGIEMGIVAVKRRVSNE